MSMACGSGACQQDGSRVLPEGLAPRAEPSRSSKMVSRQREGEQRSRGREGLLFLKKKTGLPGAAGPLPQRGGSIV